MISLRRYALFFALYFCLCLLAACGASAGRGGIGSEGGAVSSIEAPAASGTDSAGEPQPDEATVTCRVVQVKSGALLLAEADGNGLYTLEPAGIEPTVDGNSTAAADIVYLPGTLLTVTHDGMILETYPAQFANILGIDIHSDGFDDLSRVYLNALEDLWEIDDALSESIVYIGVDLSKTRLSQGEQSAVAWAFANEHEGTLLEGTYDELLEQGYITGEPVADDGSQSHKFYEWKDGVLFSIAEEEGEPGSPSGQTAEGGQETVTFNAEEWRGGLGAFFFTDCTSRRGTTGGWSDYQVGAMLIS